jgi:small subunit ribosomal protein S19
MVGHKLGEFSPTRKFMRHGGKMAKEQEAASASNDKAKMAAAKAPVKK